MLNDTNNLEKIYHQTVKKVTNDYETMNFNTAISQMMIFINAIYKEDVFPKEYALNLLKLLNPIVPHITEELWQHIFDRNEGESIMRDKLNIAEPTAEDIKLAA